MAFQASQVQENSSHYSSFKEIKRNIQKKEKKGKEHVKFFMFNFERSQFN